MALSFEELDQRTRSFMIDEFEAEEQSGNAYRSKTLSSSGLQVFSSIMRSAITSGDEIALCRSLAVPEYWKAVDGRSSRVNLAQAAERLSITEFNTWYVRGLAKRLMDEGVETCQIYRAGIPKGQVGMCCELEGRIVATTEVYAGHRAKYWPAPGNRHTLSIPAGPSCHHSIRRTR